MIRENIGGAIDWSGDRIDEALEWGDDAIDTALDFGDDIARGIGSIF